MEVVTRPERLWQSQSLKGTRLFRFAHDEGNQCIGSTSVPRCAIDIAAQGKSPASMRGFSVLHGGLKNII